MAVRNGAKILALPRGGGFDLGGKVGLFYVPYNFAFGMKT